MNEERLREMYGAELERGTTGVGTAHVTAEAIAALVRRAGPEQERLVTLDHVMRCRDCRAEFDLLRSIEQAGRQSGAARAGARRTWFIPAAIAATVLLAIGIGRLVPGSRDDGLTRGGTDALVLMQPPTDAAAGDSLMFLWNAVPRARRYSVEVLDTGGSVVAAAETTDTSVTPGTAAALPPGNYTWWVRATTADARTVRSAMRPLRLIAK